MGTKRPYRVEITFFNDHDLDYERKYLRDKKLCRSFASYQRAKEFLHSNETVAYILRIKREYAVSDYETNIVQSRNR